MKSVQFMHQIFDLKRLKLVHAQSSFQQLILMQSMGQMACPMSPAPTLPTVAPAAPETVFVTSRL